jgi:hypothetical protein
LEEIIYKEKVNQLDTLIRQCSISLRGIASTVDTSDSDNLINNMLNSYPRKKELEE